MQRVLHTVTFFVILAVLFVIFGCGHFFKTPEDHPYARQLLRQIEEINADLTSFKGIAHMTMNANKQTTSGRIAIASQLPDKIRVELLNPLGQPLTSLSGDGKKITLFIRSENKIYHLRQSTNALERLIHIPIKIEELHQAILGRVSFATNESVQLENIEDDMCILTIWKRWHGKVAELKVDRKTTQLLSLETYSRQGNLLYHVQWSKWRSIGNYKIPYHIIIKSNDRQLTISIDRFWPNADMPPSTFNLCPSINGYFR